MNTAANHLEAWKAVIDFVKTIISISAAILTAFVGYYALNQLSLGASLFNFISPLLLLASIVAALFGFGRSIKAISSGATQVAGVLLSNVSAILLLGGILAVSLINTGGNKTLDKILDEIDHLPPVAGFELKPDAVQTIVMDDQNYVITYDRFGACVTVTYSKKEGRIIKVQRQPNAPIGKTP